MNWIGAEVPSNADFKYCVVYREMDWRKKTDVAKAALFDKIAAWLRSQMPASEYYLSAPHGLVMFRDNEAQTMFLLAWTNDGQT